MMLPTLVSALLFLLPATRPIADAAHQVATQHPLAEGPAMTEAVLLAIAQHESGFRDSVRMCVRKGDMGRAIGTYQLHAGAWGSHTPIQICASDRLQAGLALGVLHRAEEMWPDLGWEGAVRAYAAGNPRASKAADEIIALVRLRLESGA